MPTAPTPNGTEQGMLGDLIVDCGRMHFCWPDAPRPNPTAQLEVHVVFDGGIGSGAGKWNCSPSPPDVPTHIRCDLAADTPSAQGSCIDNPRMRSDCASDVAGGLVEVYWQ